MAGYDVRQRHRGTLRPSADQEERTRDRNQLLDTIARSEEEVAREQVRGERMSAMRHSAPPAPTAPNAGMPGAPDAEAGNPRGVNYGQHMLGPTRSGRVRGEDVSPYGDNSVGAARAQALGRAEAAAEQREVDALVRPRMPEVPAYTKGGLTRHQPRWNFGPGAQGSGGKDYAKSKGKGFAEGGFASGMASGFDTGTRIGSAVNGALKPAGAGKKPPAPETGGSSSWGSDTEPAARKGGFMQKPKGKR